MTGDLGEEAPRASSQRTAREAEVSGGDGSRRRRTDFETAVQKTLERAKELRFERAAFAQRHRQSRESRLRRGSVSTAEGGEQQPRARDSRLSRDAALVVAGWGNHGRTGDRAEYVRRQLPALHCLRLNGSGEPAHPLYLPKTLTPFPMPAFTGEP